MLVQWLDASYQAWHALTGGRPDPYGPDVTLNATPQFEVMRAGRARLTRMAPAASKPALRGSVLLVPSLINRHYVFDLTPGFSLAEMLRDAGFDTYLLDWGAPEPEDARMPFDALFDPVLTRAIDAASTHGKPVLMGFSMGATLSTLAATLWSDRLSGLVNLMGPVDFDDAGVLGDWVKKENFDPSLIVKAYGNVPISLMQSGFRALQPWSGLHAAQKTWGKRATDPEARFHEALKRWSWDNIPFPGAVYETYIRTLYQQNQLKHGQMRVLGQPARADAIAVPALVVSGAHDALVPHAAAEALVDMAPGTRVDTVRTAGGHVSGVLGTDAQRTLWPTLRTWLQQACAA